MKIRYFILSIISCLPLMATGEEATNLNKADLFFGEALYFAYQDDYFDALVRQNIAVEKIFGQGKPVLIPAQFRFGDPKYFSIDYELSYRVYSRAIQNYWEISEGNIDPLVRNEAAYRLARIYMLLDDQGNALKNINKISGNISSDTQEDIDFLRARIYMDIGKFDDAARTLEKLKSSKKYKGFAFYNLGVAFLKGGQEQLGLNQLEKAGDISGDDEVSLSIRDKANLTLGYRLLDTKQPERVGMYLDRVRMDGPFSNKALMGYGLAEVAQGRFERALTPWTALSRRDVTDNSVQESLLGVPFAFAQLNLPGRATMLYGEALDLYDRELSRLDESIKTVNDGRFLKALLKKEKALSGDFSTRLSLLPDTPETRYLKKMIISREFRRALGNFLDLAGMSRKLEIGELSLKDFGILVNSRRQFYGPLKYEQEINSLIKRSQEARKRIKDLLIKQGKLLEVMAINHLSLRRNYLQDNQSQARLALVENYERAKKQAQTSGVK